MSTPVSSIRFGSESCQPSQVVEGEGPTLKRQVANAHEAIRSEFFSEEHRTPPRKASAPFLALFAFFFDFTGTYERDLQIANVIGTLKKHLADGEFEVLNSRRRAKGNKMGPSRFAINGKHYVVKETGAFWRTIGNHLSDRSYHSEVWTIKSIETGAKLIWYEDAEKVRFVNLGRGINMKTNLPSIVRDAKALFSTLEELARNHTDKTTRILGNPEDQDEVKNLEF